MGIEGMRVVRFQVIFWAKNRISYAFCVEVVE